MTVTVGADPELFIKNEVGEIVSCIGLLPGDKFEPFPVENGAIQVDNVLAEFNITPCINSTAFIFNIRSVMEQLLGFLPNGYSTVIKSSHSFDVSYLQSVGPEAFQFGCDPDFNAWNGGVINPRPRPKNKGLRSAGGHVHIGYANPSESTNIKIVQMMDILVGLYSVVNDEDKDRRLLYGKAGCFRHKPYGVEYRTPSNFWLANEHHIKYVFECAQYCAENYSELDDLLASITPRDIVRAINTSNTKVANNLLLKLGGI